MEVWESDFSSTPSLIHPSETIYDHLQLAIYWTRCGRIKVKTQPSFNTKANLWRWMRISLQIKWFNKCWGNSGKTDYGGWQGSVLTFSASHPRCLTSRLPAMPVFPSCSLTSAITWVSRSLTLEWMALNQAWAVTESLLLRITVCLASGEWISSCLEKQRERG